jgi:SAM-dependent methyltransferase
MDQDRLNELRASYDRVADEYVRHIYDELDHKPFDRQLLDQFAERARDMGLVCEIGSGPGHVARYLAQRGATVCGIDLSPAMVERARKLNPGLEFTQGDMLALDVRDEAFAGIVAFYSIIHIPREQVQIALREFRRVLQRGGLLLLAFHIGEGLKHLDEWWGYTVSVDTFFFTSQEMAGYTELAGFRIEDVIERPPYEGVEYPSHRGYILAKKPDRDEKSTGESHEQSATDK